MAIIRLNSLKIENFKKITMFCLRLDGRSATIYGDNATGKSSVYDAFTWALFFKDSSGNGDKNFEVKPLNSNGEVKDHQAITSVEVEFDADGEIITFQRTYREIWATRRGTGTPVYEGNTSDYFVNGVPVKKNAYDAAIKDLVSEELFRMLTNTTYFASGMKYQERRAVLFDMAGTLTDKEIMAGNAAFAPLLDSLGALSLAEYKAKLMHQKKGLTGVRDDSPTRINECQRTLQDIASIDFEEAKQMEQELIQKKDGLQAQLLALDQDTVLEKKRLELREAKLERKNIESQNDLFREQQRKAGPDLNAFQRSISAEKARLERNRIDLGRTEQRIQRYEHEIQTSRDEYVRVNGEAFAGGICPSCGQALPFEQLQEATRVFDLKKKQMLESIIARADQLKKIKQEEEATAERIRLDIQQGQESIAYQEDEVRKAQISTVEVKNMDGYYEELSAVNERIDALQLDISRLMADSSKVREQLRADIQAVDSQWRFVQGVIAKESIKEQTEKRIEQLKADARNAAEALENIEQMLYQMEEFTRFKAKFVENSINDLFRVATFRLFREQANGGLEERCDVVYDGVPFMGLNNGMKVNVGIDIINALSRHYGVTVPLFVDNAEAVTRLEPCNSQVIRLVVSENDKELRIE